MRKSISINGYFGFHTGRHVLTKDFGNLTNRAAAMLRISDDIGDNDLFWFGMMSFIFRD